MYPCSTLESQRMEPKMLEIASAFIFVVNVVLSFIIYITLANAGPFVDAWGLMVVAFSMLVYIALGVLLIFLAFCYVYAFSFTRGSLIWHSCA